MVDFAVDYRVAVDDMTNDRAMELRKWELSDDEWEIASQLRDVLKVRSGRPHNVSILTFNEYQIFKHATLFFSRDTPNLTVVIPAMDYIDEYLSTASEDMSLAPAICAAVGYGKVLLNKYYDKTDHSELYRIAMSKPFLLFFVFRCGHSDWYLQFYILATSLVTSRRPDGRLAGSTRRSGSCVRNGSASTHFWTTQQRSQEELHTRTEAR